MHVMSIAALQRDGVGPEIMCCTASPATITTFTQVVLGKIASEVKIDALALRAKDFQEWRMYVGCKVIVICHGCNQLTATHIQQ